MNQDTKELTFGFFILSIICVVIGIGCGLIPSEYRINTLADEPKIFEMAKARSEIKGAYDFDWQRTEIINQLYSKREVEGLGKTSAKIWLAIAAVPLFAGLFILIGGIWQSDLGNYWKARAQYWQNKTKSERKVLDDLLVLQRKIAKGSLDD